MIEWIQHESQALKGFPMGDPHLRRFPVYLPPNYDRKRADPYPVFFLLAGWSGRGSKYISDESVFSIPLDQCLDKKISSGEMLPLIAVFPDGSSKLGCSQYVNSPSLGRYSDYICDELVEHIDKNYHTHRSEKYRGIIGHSSGGFGALINGISRPDCFQFVCSSAGDSLFEISLLLTAVPLLNEVNKAGGVEKFIEDFFKSSNPGSASRSKMDALMTLSLASCYAPDPKKGPVFGELFIDLQNGKIIEDVWQKYLDWDPIRFLRKHSALAKKLQFVLLEAGLQDEFALQWGHRQIADELTSLQIPHQLNEYPGGHSGHHWRMEGRIQRLLQEMHLKA